MIDMIIIGAGPAGLSASMYAKRAGKSVLILEKGVFGGQMTFSPKIENYPGFESLSGNALADKMVSQALDMDVPMEMETVTGIVDNGKYKTVVTEENRYDAKAVIIATGAAHRHLNVAGEASFLGKGISFCAVCDGAFFKDMDVAVVGGGNSALQEALALSTTSKTVTLIQNLANLTGEKVLEEKLRSQKNVTVLTNSVVESFHGGKALEAVTVLNTQTGETKTLAVSGAFIAIGLAPATGEFANLITLDKGGYVMANETCLTNVPGIFTAGDCRTKTVRQITTAVADGSIASLAACDYLRFLEA